jgi:hydroxymethylpyrimidine pyrophosphatase-like HAD family hydrolase
MTLVVFDMDGTLLDAQSKISPFTSETLSLMRQNGIAYTVATTRHSEMTLKRNSPIYSRVSASYPYSH